MRKLNAAVERFALTHPRFGVPNLMKYIVFGNVIAFFVLRLWGIAALDFLALDWSRVLHGQIWRLVTFIFVPETSQPFQLILSLYFMYFIGNMLEREWGTPKFNLYYLSGAVLTALTALVSFIAFRSGVTYGTYYVGMSMFLAFAVLYPDAQILLFYIIPVKAKWLAIADLVLFAVDILRSLAGLRFLQALLPIAALLNFLVFFWCDLMDLMDRQRGYARHRNCQRTVQFQSAVRRQKKREAERGYRHKCEVCGRTDTEWPDLEFRYCSKCAGYHCFCSDHIFQHEHFRS